MKKIFLADDSLTIQKVVELTFPEGQYEVICASNGAQALQRIPEVSPDIALLDVIMPEQNGYEVCAQIKRNPGLAWIPVLLLTGTFEPYDEKRAKEVGASGHLTKPFESKALVSRVEELLASSRRPGASAEAAPAPAPPAPAPRPQPPAPVGSQLGQTARMKASDIFSQIPPGAPAARPADPSRPADPPRPADLPRPADPPRQPAEVRPQTTSTGRLAALTTPPTPAPAAQPKSAEQPPRPAGRPEPRPSAAEPPRRAPEASPRGSEASPRTAAAPRPEPQPSIPAGPWGPQQQEAFEKIVRQTLSTLAPETIRRVTEEALTQAPGNATPLGRQVHETIERAARDIIAPIAEKVAREVAWEVIPDLAESLVRRRIRELEEGSAAGSA